MRQEREYPGRVSGTELVNPDFTAFARSFGAHAETVPGTDGFEPALERALAAAAPSVLSLRVDPEAITPRATLTELREAALRR
jgi:acetolactate synthase-1/2/3 large subunit